MIDIMKKVAAENNLDIFFDETDLGSYLVLKSTKTSPIFSSEFTFACDLMRDDKNVFYIVLRDYVEVLKDELNICVDDFNNDSQDFLSQSFVIRENYPLASFDALRWAYRDCLFSFSSFVQDLEEICYDE